MEGGRRMSEYERDEEKLPFEEITVPPQVFDLRDESKLKAFRRVLERERLDELVFLLQDIDIPTGNLTAREKRAIVHYGMLALDLLAQKLRNKGQLSFDYLIVDAQARASLMARISRGDRGFTLRMAVTRRFEQPSQQQKQGGFFSRIFG